MSKVDEALQLLGFDPTKKGAIPQDSITKALAKIREEATAAQVAEAEKILRDLMAIMDKKSQLSKDFDKAIKKIDGEAGQLLARLRGQVNAAQGQTSPEASSEPAQS